MAKPNPFNDLEATTTTGFGMRKTSFNIQGMGILGIDRTTGERGNKGRSTLHKLSNGFSPRNQSVEKSATKKKGTSGDL